MLSIAHAATGAFIATHVASPALAVPLILLSHYLADRVPHWDAGTGLSNGSKTKAKAFRHGMIDLALAGVVVLIMFPINLDIQYSIFDILKLPMIWGSFLGLLPDFLEAPRNFLKYEPRWLAPLNRFHHSFHHSIPRMWDGLAPQILLLTILWIFK